MRQLLEYWGGNTVLDLGDGADVRIGAAVRGVVRPPDARARGYATMAWEIAGDGN